MLLRADSSWLTAVAVTAIYASVSWSLGPPREPARTERTPPAPAPRPPPPDVPRALPAPQRLTADAAGTGTPPDTSRPHSEARVRVEGPEPRVSR
jgi:hypothetical protein